MLNGPLRTFFKNLIEVVVGNTEAAGLPGSRWNVAKELMNQIAKPGPDFFQRQIAAEEPYTAIDIKTHAPRRDDTILRVDSGYAANRKTVTLVDIRHCKSAPHNAGKHRDVGCLFQRLIAPDGFEQSLARVYQRVRKHARLIRPRDQPTIIVDFLELHIKRPRTRGSPNRPMSDDFRIGGRSQP